MTSLSKKIGRAALWVVTLLAAASIIDVGLSKFHLSWFDPLFGIFLYSIILAARWPWRKRNAS
jgi:Co/Zn/Cd efflux system component